MRTAILIAALLVAATAQADNTIYRQLDSERVAITKFEGKPPFDRKVVKIKDLSAAQFARFEEQVQKKPESKFKGPPARGFPAR